MFFLVCPIPVNCCYFGLERFSIDCWQNDRSQIMQTIQSFQTQNKDQTNSELYFDLNRSAIAAKIKVL